MRLSDKTLAGFFLAIAMILSSTQLQAQEYHIDPGAAINQEHAKKFASVVVQDHNGRMKPFNTLASEVLRKVSRKEKLYDQTADQIFLGMMVYPQYWAEVPLIKTSREEAIQKLIPSEGILVAYNDFFKPDYILKEQVRTAYNMEPKYRGTFEKEIIKIDERVNICNLVFTGRLLRIFPTEDPNSDTWSSPGEVQHLNQLSGTNTFAGNYFNDIRMQSNPLTNRETGRYQMK